MPLLTYKWSGFKLSQRQYFSLWVLRSSGDVSLGPTTLAGVSDGDTGEALLCCCRGNSLPQETSPVPSLVFFHKQAKPFFFRQAFPLYLATYVWFLYGLLCFDLCFPFFCFPFLRVAFVFPLLFNIGMLTFLSFKYCILMLSTTIVYSLFSALNIVLQCCKPPWVLFQKKGGVEIL